ncbi:MAG: hypothetical protein K0V04_33600 [Deltaproteobacteria bacterium]|nr:hypothetical protein [Deltaproteobacteria bacterium]
MVRRRRWTARLGLVVGLLAAPGTVAAEDGSDTNRWRVHLGADLGSWVRQTPWPRVPDRIAGSRDHFGFIGLRRLHLGMGIGHGFRDRFVAGLHLQYEISRGIQRTLAPGAEARAVTVGAMPYFTVMFDRKHVVRPYLSIRAGMGGGLLTVLDPSPLDRPERSSSLLYPLLAFDVGAHAFVSPDVSLDGMLSVEHRWEYLRGTTPSMVPEGTAQIRSEAGHLSFGRRFSTSIVLAVSRWF